MSPKSKLDRAYAWAKGIAIVLALTLATASLLLYALSERIL